MCIHDLYDFGYLVLGRIHVRTKVAKLLRNFHTKKPLEIRLNHISVEIHLLRIGLS